MKPLRKINRIAIPSLAAALFLSGCSSKSLTSSPINPMSNLSESPNPYKVIVSSKNDDPKWIFGEDGQDGTKQGSHNWYYMYTEETNTHGAYDVSKIRECWYSEIDGGGSCISSSKGGNQATWVAGIYDKDTDIWSTNNWWNQSIGYMSMNLSPAVSKGAYASAILAFKAPEDGNYLLDISFTAGNNNPSQVDNDGVTVSIYADTKKLYSQAIRDTLLEGEILSVNAMLKADQYAYIIVDPNENGNDDICHSVRMEVTQTFSTYIDNDTAWAFGKSYLNGDGTKQGVNNWYYMYTEETNTGGIYDVSYIKECWYKQLGDTNPFTNRTFGTWVAGIYGENLDLSARGNRWRQTAYGQICPGMHNSPYATVVLAWKAPASSVYSIDLQMFGGSTGTGDGITVSVYGGTKTIYSERIEGNKYLVLHAEISLEKDEYYYIFVDPNESGFSDIADDLDTLIQKLTT